MLGYSGCCSSSLFSPRYRPSALYQPVLDDPAAYIAGGGKDNQIYLGVLLEVLLIIANVGTAVVVYPILSARTRSFLSAMSPLAWWSARSSQPASSSCSGS